MTRPDWWLTALLLATLPAQAGETLDADFLAFLADEAEQSADKDGKTPDPELVAWLRDWWNPADADAQPVRKEETP